MTASGSFEMDSLDPFERPPDRIRNVYKKYQKMKVQDLEKDIDIADIDSDTSLFRKGNIKTSKIILEDDLVAAFSTYTGSARLESPVSPVPVYEHRDMPGRFVVFETTLFWRISSNGYRKYLLHQKCTLYPFVRPVRRGAQKVLVP